MTLLHVTILCVCSAKSYVKELRMKEWCMTKFHVTPLCVCVKELCVTKSCVCVKEVCVCVWGVSIVCVEGCARERERVVCDNIVRQRVVSCARQSSA